MKRHRHLVPLLLVVLASVPVFADDNRRDGNWWLNQPKAMRGYYVIGFFDGMHLGNSFSWWKYGDDKKSRETWIPLVAKSYDEYMQKYLYNVNSNQLVDGLDSFYSDYRNRRIRIKDAVWLVVNGIGGTPEAELNKMIESWRRNAAN